MRLLEEDIRKTTPILCEIQRDYIKYMHDADWRVSVKYNNRKFVGLAVQINGRMFVVPLTSQTMVLCQDLAQVKMRNLSSS